jgi:hypothetical protein
MLYRVWQRWIAEMSLEMCLVQDSSGSSILPYYHIFIVVYYHITISPHQIYRITLP